ncbi:MAG: transcriptional regulator [Pirellulaceae bacterium]|nr:MAG: transcriptional regulator [Pirellulaceae bacterium]
MAIPDDPCWVGFDLGGTKMLAVLFDGQFQPLARKRKKSKGHEGEQAGLNRIMEMIEELLDEAGVERQRLAGIGVGCPGPVQLEEGVVHEAINLGWRHVPVRKRLEDRFGCPVEVANDVDLGVYAEWRFGAARGARTAVGIFPGTGIGGGCVYQGEILRGHSVSAMEIGHIRVLPDGPLCGCGGRGCLEAVASRLAIASEAARAAYRGDAPHLRRLAGTAVEDIRSGVLAEAIALGDTVVEQIVRHAARALGLGVAALVHLLAPEVVVLGGGLVEAMPAWYVQTVHQAAREALMPAYRDLFEVKPAQLGDDATALGAAAWAEKRHSAAEPVG